MYTNAVGVALFIQFVNTINDMKWIGLRKANHDLSSKVDNSRAEIKKLLEDSNSLLVELYYQELYIIALDEELDSVFNHIWDRSMDINDDS